MGEVSMRLVHIAQMAKSREGPEAQGRERLSGKDLAVLLYDLAEIDREWDRKREAGMLELRQAFRLSAKELRFWKETE